MLDSYIVVYNSLIFISFPLVFLKRHYNMLIQYTLLAAAAVLAVPPPHQVQVQQVPAGAVQMNVKRSVHQVAESKKRLKARADFSQVVEDKISNQKFYYSSTVQIGNPGQLVDVLIDTGSSDTWVISLTTKYVGQKPGPSSFFDPNQSETWKSNQTNFDITYGVGHTTGQWGTDVFKIGDAELKGMSIGVADKTDVRQGIIGIGRPQAEITNKQKKQYSNLPQKLFEAGLTNSPAFSLFLNDANSDSGTILFGAVDHSKYQGELMILPITHFAHYGITLSEIRAAGTQNVLSQPMTAILDSGTTLSYFNEATVKAIHQAIGAKSSFALNGKFYADCHALDKFVFNFGDGAVQITVPASQILTPIENYVRPGLASMTFPRNSCFVGIDVVPKNADYLLLGDNVIRSAYIVYDPQNKQIALAQANFRGRESTPDDIQLISQTLIPGARRASGQQQTLDQIQSQDQEEDEDQLQQQDQIEQDQLRQEQQQQ